MHTTFSAHVESLLEQFETNVLFPTILMSICEQVSKFDSCHNSVSCKQSKLRQKIHSKVKNQTSIQQHTFLHDSTFSGVMQKTLNLHEKSVL